jgi:hypothetical protein
MSNRISTLALCALSLAVLAGAAAGEPAAAPSGPLAVAAATTAPTPPATRADLAPPSLLSPPAAMSPLQPPSQVPVQMSQCTNQCTTEWNQCKARCMGDKVCLLDCTNFYVCCIRVCDGEACQP